MIKVLIVDDSATARAALRLGLAHAKDLLIVGEATDGREAVRQVHRQNPDIVLMDVFMRGENGLDATRAIMAEAARPVVIITGINPGDPELAFRALEVGALEVLPKLPSPNHADYDERCRRLARSLRNLSRVPVVTRFHRASPVAHPEGGGSAGPVASPRREARLVLLGASTGGPPLLREILGALPAPYPLPIVIAQHITQGFGAGFGAWLGQVTGHEVSFVDTARTLQPGRIYVASDETQLRMIGADRVAPFLDPSAMFSPSIDDLFESAARFVGAAAVGVLLTGMGSDGARGMVALHGQGALTVAQRPDTCAVSAMPEAAITRGAASQVLAPPQIVGLLTALPHHRHEGPSPRAR